MAPAGPARAKTGLSPAERNAVHGQWQKQASFQCLASPCAAFLLYFHQICIKFVYLCPRPQYWGMSHKLGLC
ncbi:hypothetical protein CAY53_04520 [Desulfobulbus oralis]|uniref:Uncharacterized protein n=1 Tax=Desulfobulbus oralis TaxID=1986146 RepID=A0A2L1GMC7_9BACT|nr:hypothetical protein CAY53_04520 [Desulfobulbus oralis]